MDFVIIPFHDWRKSEKEGFRTRDVHFINTIGNTSENKILVINRPLTTLELLYKRHNKQLVGKRISEDGNFTLTQVKDNIFVADYHSSDVVGQAIKKFKWFIERYNDTEYTNFIKKCYLKLGFDQPFLITQNVFAYKLAISLDAKVKLFDAWDNFLKFPGYRHIKEHLNQGYSVSAREIKKWTTNSNENLKFYKNTFDVDNIKLIKNGVKSNFTSGDVNVPEDLQSIKRPWIGFGGKISYLIDYDLINYISKKNPDFSFVFVGQILDKKVYNKIEKRENVYFLGDKKYNIYPNYVRSFDICIVPYNIKNKQHGGDSMKAYEYLISNKKVVGTNGNGLEDLKKFIYVTESMEEFSKELNTLENKKMKLPIEKHSWESKVNEILCLLKE